ncbi:hypothetical protein B0H13DRAFT_2336400 [Mycena leptocephala]|nr:hypothetical protein B0H13DRAFT_2336400 [Mycena leptocephala]
MHLSVYSRRRYVAFLVVLMSLFYFLKVALHDDRRSVPIASAAPTIDDQPRPKDEQAVAVVAPPTPESPTTLCALMYPPISSGAA